MKTRTTISIVLVFLLATFTFSACGGDRGNMTTRMTEQPTPTSQGGHDQRGDKTVGLSSDKPVSIPGAFPTEGGVPMLVHLFDAGSFDPNGYIVKWEWNFGDQEEGQGGWHDYTESQGDAWHTYTRPGTIVAHLRVTDNDGNKDTAFVKIKMSEGGNTNPVAVANGAPLTGTAPLTVTFSATGSYDPDGNIVKWEWDFGDGVFQDFTDSGGNAEYTYNTAGMYTAVLRVTDDDGATGSSSRELEVFQQSTWIHTWGGSAAEWAMDVESDALGNVYVAGNTRSFGVSIGIPDGLLLKYSPEGEVLWAKTWGGSLDEYFIGITVDEHGDVYVAGRTDTFGVGNGYADALVLKYSSSGELLWAKTWGGNRWEQANAVGIDANGDVLVAGETASFGAGSGDFLLMKYSKDGDLLWAKTWGGTSPDAQRGFTLDSDGSVYLTGFTVSFGEGQHDALLLKYAPSGELLWARTWGGSADDSANAVTVDQSLNVYVAAYTRSFGSGSFDAVLLKYTKDGHLLWQQAWGGPDWDESYGVAIVGGGSIYVAGTTPGFGAGERDVFILNYTSEGHLLQSKIWGTNGVEYAESLKVDEASMLYLPGTALNAYGDWRSPVGTTLTLAGSEHSPAGTEQLPTAVETLPQGVETNPEGAVEDDGGGGSDVLIMKLDPSKL